MEKAKLAKSLRDLKVYNLAFETSMEIFDKTKQFPKEEKYSLSDQINRSSRSVCANLAEAWRGRRYKTFFSHKLTQCTQEAAETQVWLQFALKCGYIDRKTLEALDERYEHISAMLMTMIKMADSFCKECV
jgi:four helix bundle protein